MGGSSSRDYDYDQPESWLLHPAHGNLNRWSIERVVGGTPLDADAATHDTAPEDCPAAAFFVHGTVASWEAGV